MAGEVVGREVGVVDGRAARANGTRPAVADAVLPLIVALLDERK